MNVRPFQRMMPIQQLFSRILHDAEFARGKFVLAYFDRVERRLIQVPFSEIEFPTGENVLRLVDSDGRAHRVPFHRVREVFKDGQLIWRRPGMESD